MKKLLLALSLFTLMFTGGCQQESGSDTKEKQITYTLDGETITEKAVYTNSAEQPYDMYILPGYTLTSEEPGQDLLYVTNQEEISMRIQLYTEPDWESIEQNVAAELDYIGDITHPDNEQLQIDEAKIFESSNEEERVTIYLIKDEDNPMKLTIFSPAGTDYRHAFVEMAKTIERTE
ncbi:MAG: hypothetical protein ACI4XL_11925 [Bacillus sp. (in: firmicutes)]